MSVPANSPRADPAALSTAHRDANDHRALTAALAGTCVAVLTFALFFLYDRWTAGSINGLLFQATILTVVGALFLMSFSSMNYWFVMEAVRSDHPGPDRYVRPAEAFFAAGWVLLILEPALILFTVRLDYLGGAALAFWVVAIVMMALGWAEARRHLRGRAVEGRVAPQAGRGR